MSEPVWNKFLTERDKAVQHLMATDGLVHQRPSLLLEVGSLLRQYERPLPEMHIYDHLLVGAGR